MPSISRSEDPVQPHACFLERERTHSGTPATVASLFLINRRCPWQCVMCDLWKNTLTEDTPPGAIPAQIRHGLEQLQTGGDPGPPTQIKLYNSGSFFDRRAIPPADHGTIAGLVRGFERVIVECHPALVNGSALRFRDQLGPNTQLEIAMGLETVHPEILPRLNKGMTLDQFAAAATFLHDNQIGLRAFILVKPPFLPEPEAVEWSNRSVDFAIECHATVASLIPTRLGNEPLNQLAARGEFAPPRLSTLETALDCGVQRRGTTRVFADLWDLAQFSDCPDCLGARTDRLQRINLTQSPEPPVSCPGCTPTG